MVKVPEVFKIGKQVDLPAMLDAREERVSIQRNLLSKLNADNQGSLLLMTMAIPGPIKENVILNQAFDEVLEEVLNVLGPNNIIQKEKREKVTGLEFYVLSMLSPQEMKEQMIKIEEEHPLGRLFDLDVIKFNKASEIEGVSRTQFNWPVRRCFICDQPAKECGRSRRHSVLELQEEISRRVISYLDNK